jgi:hypothetical protein
MISTCGSLALYLNLDALEAAGVDPEVTPRTIGELDEMNDRVLARSAGRRDRADGVPAHRARLVVVDLGLPLRRQPDRRAGDPTADDPRNVAAYEWVRSYPDRFGSRELLAFQSGLGFYGTAQYPFLTGKVASVVQGPWMANLIRRFAPQLRYRAVPIPVEDSVYDADAPDRAARRRRARRSQGRVRTPRRRSRSSRGCRIGEARAAGDRAHGKNSPLREVSLASVSGHPNRSIEVHNKLASSPRAFVFPRTRVWPRYV